MKSIVTRSLLNSFYASNLPWSWNINFERSDAEKRRRVSECLGDRSRADYFTNDQQRVLGSEQALNLNLVHRVQRQKHGSATDRQRPRGVSHSWINTETKKPTNLRTKSSTFTNETRIRSGVLTRKILFDRHLGRCSTRSTNLRRGRQRRR